MACIKILVGQAGFELWIKTVKIMFWSVTQEPLGQTNAAVNGHLELPLLKDLQRFDAISTSNLEVFKFRYIFGHGESSPDNIWSMVNLERTCLLLFYYLLCLIVNLDLEKQISLVNLHPTLVSRWWILTQLFWKRCELMVNPDLTILLKRWTEVKTWGG